MIKKNFTNFISVALVITGLLVAADGYAKKNFPEYNLKHGWAIIFIFLFLYVIIHRSVLRVGEKEPKKFVNAFMGLIGIKMLVLLTFLGAFVYMRPDEKIAFLILFLAAYFLHTVNEIFWANSFVKSIGNK